MKTDQDRAIDEALDKYLEAFGEPYPLGPGHMPTPDNMLKEIEEAIKTGVPIPEPKYDEDCDY